MKNSALFFSKIQVPSPASGSAAAGTAKTSPLLQPWSFSKKGKSAKRTQIGFYASSCI